MSRQNVIDSMSNYKEFVKMRVRKKVKEIVALCSIMRSYGKDFTFDADPELDSEVNALLLSLSDELLSDIEDRTRYASRQAYNEDDFEQIWARVSGTLGDEDLTQRIDNYSSRLKFLLEGWLAIGFAKDFSDEEIALDALGFATNPSANTDWREALADPSYKATILTDGAHFGKGVQIDPEKGYTLAGQDAIMGGFTFGSILFFKKHGAIGYRIERGSTFDCPYCDEHTGIVYPFDEVILPLHPRCCCYPVPVFADE